MKKLLFLLCLLSGGMLSAQKTVVNPPFMATSTQTIEISAVHRSDTATVLDIDAKMTPNQWMTVSPNTRLVADNGESYPIKKGIGIQLGDKLVMPASGTTTFSLIFPVLPATVKSFDFIEGPNAGDFCIYDVNLTGKLPKLPLPGNLKKQKLDTSVALPKAEIKEGKAIVSGWVMEYKPNYKLPVVLSWADLALGRSNREELKVDETGHFSFEVPVASPSVAYLMVGTSRLPIFLVQGDETKVTVNLREATRSTSRVLKNTKPEGKAIYFEGSMAALNTEMNSGKKIALCSVKPEELFDKNLAQYKAFCMEKFEKTNEAIKADKSISEAYRTLLLVLNKSELHNLLSNSNMNMGLAYAKQQGISDREAIGKFKPELPTSEYFDYLSKLDYINSPQSVYCFGYPSAVTSIAYFSLPDDGSKREDIFDYILASPKTDADDKVFIDAYRKKPSPEASKRMRVLRDKYNALFVEFSALSKAKRVKVFADLIGSGKGLYYDVSKAAECANKIGDFIPLSDEDFTRLKSMENPYFLNRLTAMNNELVQKIEANKRNTSYNVRTLGEVNDDALFDSIVAPFKGKVVLVDFWATWCGPCRMAMKAMEPMKKDLQGKDIVYVFVTGETSPLTTWENMIPDIHGEHYRLTDAQWTAICDKYEVRGVPTYIVLNKEGKKLYSSVGFPGVETMKKELLKAF